MKPLKGKRLKQAVPVGQSMSEVFPLWAWTSASARFAELGDALGVHLISVASQHRLPAEDKVRGKVASSGLC